MQIAFIYAPFRTAACPAAVLNDRGTQVGIFLGIELCFMEVWRYWSRCWWGLRWFYRCTAEPGSRGGLLDGGHRRFGVFLVFHAEWFFVLPAAVGERPWHFKLPYPVRHEEDSHRQLYSPDARPGLPGGFAALLRPGHRATARTRRPEGLSAAGGGGPWWCWMEPSISVCRN